MARKKIAVIGGGASGMMAAIAAAYNGNEVHLFEKNILTRENEFAHFTSSGFILNENKDRMMIALFEVFKPYRGRGLGKRIIAQFLQDYYGEVNLEPSGEESESFWKQCGFESDCYLDRRSK